MRRILLCLLLLSALGWADEIIPRSATAEAAYFIHSDGSRQPLKLNQPNAIDASPQVVNPWEGEARETGVLFVREGYLDLFVPSDPLFLESGFPGDFTNLERYYTLKLDTSPAQVKVYEVGRSSDKPGQKNYVGQTGGPPLRLDRSLYYDPMRRKFSQVRLLLEQAGYEPQRIDISAKELVPAKQLGTFSLVPLPGQTRPWKLLAWVVLALVVVALVRRRPRPPSLPTETMQVPTETIETYRLSELVGRGGTAEVYRATGQDGLDVAVKIMLGSEGDSEEAERFRREIKACLKLVHPNLARIYDWGETSQGRLYLVSELLVGETLSARLRKEPVGPGRDRLLISVLGEVGEALAYLHDQCVVHRDVKPGNIFLTNKGKTKLIDLGLARGGELQTMTRTGVALGTPHYMSPEQVGGDYTPQSDQYALGVIAFEIVTGQRPYQGDDSLQVLHQHLSAPIPNPRDLRPDLDLHTASVITRMLAKSPEHRYASVREAVAALATPAQAYEGDTEAFGG
ncbi:MAG: serine/threonine protein kinase [Candidatus Eremiobacteraeota bacterium]|nr:serine/threonine protein kinase [Candidatus Eremiobacteraeota bacterium]